MPYLLITVAILLPLILHAQNESFEQVSEADRLPYSVAVNGEVPSAVLKEIKAQSTLMQDDKPALASIEIATTFAHKDTVQIKDVLAKNGYFDAQVNISVTSHDGHILIVFNIDLCERYTISQKILQNRQASIEAVQHLVPESIIAPLSGDFVSFNTITLEKNKIKRILQNRGYFFATMDNPRVDIDRDCKQATVTYFYTPGNPITVADVQISREGNIPKSYIYKRISLRKGDTLTYSKVKRSKKSLMCSGLFSEVNISASKVQSTISNDGVKRHANVTIDVVPSLPRTIGAGFHISQTEGLVASAMWQNKNFMQRALDAGARIQGGIRELSATVFLNSALRYQDLHTEFFIKHLNTIAYQGDKYVVIVGVVKPPARFVYAVLPTIEFGTLKRANTSMKQTLFGGTLSATFNVANHINHPTSGAIFELTCQPYFGHLGTEADSSSAMGIFSASARGYLPLTKHSVSYNMTTLAMLVSVGKIAAKNFDHIPFDKRFYGGGKNSMRAYGYQLSGELDKDDRPVGGSSSMEFCFEPRIRISEDVGAVAFVEVSCVSKNNFSTANALCGVGLGLRYFTRFGPIRFDIAMPLKRRAKQTDEKKYVDRGFQFYISVGQSF
jgi:translocation and assembly module TamA